MRPILPSPAAPLKIGARGSPLALAQAHEARDRLAAAFDLPAEAFTVVAIRTTGDHFRDRPLREIGGKGLFTKEIEEALLADMIDIAVHSMKDMPVALPEGLVLDTCLPREDVRDALLSPRGGGIAEIERGAEVGTSSLRRRAQLLNIRPDLRVVEFRGNVRTRLDKLDRGVAAATFLAMAGLNRLGIAHVPLTPLDVEIMLPATGQGAIGVERRQDDASTAEMLAAIHDEPTGRRLVAERAFLAALEGSSEMAVAGLATLDGNAIRLRGEILRPDGSEKLVEEGSAPVEDSAVLGREIGIRLLARAPSGFFGRLEYRAD